MLFLVLDWDSSPTWVLSRNTSSSFQQWASLMFSDFLVFFPGVSGGYALWFKAWRFLIQFVEWVDYGLFENKHSVRNVWLSAVRVSVQSPAKVPLQGRVSSWWLRGWSSMTLCPRKEDEEEDMEQKANYQLAYHLWEVTRASCCIPNR